MATMCERRPPSGPPLRLDSSSRRISLRRLRNAFSATLSSSGVGAGGGVGLDTEDSLHPTRDCGTTPEFKIPQPDAPVKNPEGVTVPCPLPRHPPAPRGWWCCSCCPLPC